MKILIFPYAKHMRNGLEHPKNYPWWPELIAQLHAQGHEIVQVGVAGEPELVSDYRKNLTLPELELLVKECDTWIGVDSFGQHFCWSLGVRGIVLFGQSDPVIFGHDENVNLLKDRSYLREKQFWLWEQCDARDDAWVIPNDVVTALTAHFS
jgi:ADP-heptose:LPS heptosyltransferase